MLWEQTTLGDIDGVLIMPRLKVQKLDYSCSEIHANKPHLLKLASELSFLPLEIERAYQKCSKASTHSIC